MVDLTQMFALISNSPPEYKAIAALAILGAFSLLGTFNRLCTWLWRYLLRPGKTLTRYGSWALVIGRTTKKLDALASELKDKYKSLQVKTVMLDFMHPNLASGLSRIEQLVGGPAGVAG